jgi:hypothetical protein
MTKLSPIESEFARTEEAEAHDAWVRAKVENTLASTKPRIPHDQMLAETRTRIESRNFNRLSGRNRDSPQRVDSAGWAAFGKPTFRPTVRGGKRALAVRPVQAAESGGTL